MIIINIISKQNIFYINLNLPERETLLKEKRSYKINRSDEKQELLRNTKTDRETPEKPEYDSNNHYLRIHGRNECSIKRKGEEHSAKREEYPARPDQELNYFSTLS